MGDRELRIECLRVAKVLEPAFSYAGLLVVADAIFEWLFARTGDAGSIGQGGYNAGIKEKTITKGMIAAGLRVLDRMEMTERDQERVVSDIYREMWKASPAGCAAERRRETLEEAFRDWWSRNASTMELGGVGDVRDLRDRLVVASWESMESPPPEPKD